jgi:hypothetical protein
MITYTKESDRNLPVLKRKHIPAGFASGIFDSTMQNWSTLERELFAVVHATEKFRNMLDRNQGFIILTDHENLRAILKGSVQSDLKKVAAAKIERWKIKLNAFNFQVQYLPGPDNIMADMLSRLPRTGGENQKLDEEDRFDTPMAAIRQFKLVEKVESTESSNETVSIVGINHGFKFRNSNLE